MTSRLRLVITDRARSDIRAILRYSLREWGEQQRNRYQQSLQRAMEELTTYPELGKNRSDIADGVRGRLIGEHVILYECGSETLTVLRVVHVRMDVPSRFKAKD